MRVTHRKRMVLGTLLLVVALLCPLAPKVLASQGAKTFLAGIEAYQRGDYLQAVSFFEALAADGIQNPKLYYNLGNAYLKMDDLGRAILWYERAHKMESRDPDLNFNLAHAQTLTVDERAEGSGGLNEILFFWKYLLSAKTVKWMAIGLNALFWVFLGLHHLMPKRLLKLLAVAALLPTVIFTLTALYNYHEAKGLREAVVIPETVSVRSGLSDEATELFVLHAGSKVKIQKENQDYLRIQYGADKIGWMRRQDLGII